jgi:hypothetical protein
MAKGTQPPFTILVANLNSPSDPSAGVAAGKARTAFTTQIVRDDDGNYRTGTLSGTVSGCTASITVVTAAAPTSLLEDVIFIGSIEIIEDRDFTVVGADTDATATRLAAAINNLAGFSAEVNGVTTNQVDITGPSGPVKIPIKIVTRSGNYTLSGNDGDHMTQGTPSVGGPIITS